MSGAEVLTGSLGAADYAWAALALAVLLAVSYFKGRDEADTQDFFVARRKIPVWAAALSFLATEISAMTIVGVPAAGFKENWQYLQFFIGSALARLFVAFVFIPAFYKHDCTTIYQYLGQRFGPGTQYAGSAFFFINHPNSDIGAFNPTLAGRFGPAFKTSRRRHTFA